MTSLEHRCQSVTADRPSEIVTTDPRHDYLAGFYISQRIPIATPYARRDFLAESMLLRAAVSHISHVAEDDRALWASDALSLVTFNPGKRGTCQRTPKPGLAFLSSISPHDRNVSIRLICYHLPATCQASQDGSFGAALREQHEAMAFISLGSASICVIHDYAFTVVDHL